jgi:RNA polymerase sigma-70 factor (ECF subfamily)
MTVGDSAKDPSEQLTRLLVAVAEDRDRQAFQSLFLHFAPRVKAFVLSQRTDPGLAEEIVQETMVNVWRKAAQFQPAKASASTWVFTIARNMRIDMLRKSNRPEPDVNDPAMVPDAEPPAHERISREQEAARLRKAFAGLPEEQREILQLVFFEEKTHTEAAQHLDIPLGTVKSRIRLALKRVRSEVGERE